MHILDARSESHGTAGSCVRHLVLLLLLRLILPRRCSAGAVPGEGTSPGPACRHEPAAVSFTAAALYIHLRSVRYVDVGLDNLCKQDVSVSFSCTRTPAGLISSIVACLLRYPQPILGKSLKPLRVCLIQWLSSDWLGIATFLVVAIRLV